MELSYRRSETAYYFCSEVKKPQNSLFWLAGITGSCCRPWHEKLNPGGELVLYGIIALETVMHILYFTYSLFNTVRASQFDSWINGSGKKYPDLSIGKSWMKIPGNELCLLWNLPEKLLTKQPLGTVWTPETNSQGGPQLEVLPALLPWSLQTTYQMFGNGISFCMLYLFWKQL